MKVLPIALCALQAWNLKAEGTGRAAVRTGLQQRTGRSLPETAGPGGRKFTLPPGVTLEDKLSAEDAVAIALWNNAALEADLAALGIAEADLKDAGLHRNPSFSTLIPVGAKPFEFLLNWPVEEFWQRKKRVLAARRNLDAIATGLVQNGLNLIRDVRMAHADLWLAEQRAGALREAAAVQERLAGMAGRRLEAGDASGLEVRMALAAARSAAEIAQRATGDTEAARARLLPLIGLRDDPRPLSAAGAGNLPSLPALQEMVTTAYASRPDLRAAELAMEAAAYRAKWQRSRILAMLIPIVSVKEAGSPSAVRAGPGLQAELPIFNRNQGQIARADAEVVQAARRYAALRDQVEADVRQAAARLEQARASVAQLRGEVRPAVEQVIERMERAYRDGDASYLNVLETSRQRFDVVLRELDAEASMVRAAAELERAIGRKP